MVLQKTSFADLKTLIAEAEASNDFIASKPQTDNTITDVILKMIVKDKAETFELLDDSATAVGFAVLLYSETHLSIGPIYITKASRAKGYSKILLQEIVAVAKQKGFSIIATKTWGENKASRHLFESYGFTQTKEVLDSRVNGDSTVSYIFELHSD